VVTESVLEPYFTTIISKINGAAGQINALPPGAYKGDGLLLPEYHDCTNVIAVIITKVIKLLVFVVLILKLFAACDKAICSLLSVIGSLLIGILGLAKALYVAPPALDRRTC
jgi:hypothetical protein